MDLNVAVKQSIAGAAYRLYYKTKNLNEQGQMLIVHQTDLKYPHCWYLVYPDSFEFIRELTSFEVTQKTNGYYDWWPVGETEDPKFGDFINRFNKPKLEYNFDKHRHEVEVEEVQWEC